MICIEGIVRSVSSVKPEYDTVCYECMRCGNMTMVVQSGKKMVEPFECENQTCGRKGPWKIIPQQSKYIDSQVIEMQESPDALRGTQPRSIQINLCNELVDNVTAGDKILVTGVLVTSQAMTKEGKSRKLDTVIEANHIEKLDKSYDELEITQEDVSHIYELSKQSQIKEMIINSIAPSVYGLDEQKEAIALSLFSGVVKCLPDGSRIRGDIHLLFMGDPGVAKSVLIRRAVALSPRGIFNSGKSASTAGLTAAATKDSLNEDRWKLEAGSLVLADNGLCAVDEMDKMTQEDQSALHEAMEQQTITVSKAGIHAELLTRCALVGAANPVSGRFDRNDTNFAAQINMKPSLLSRFDIIYMLQDIPEEEQDRRIASHISNNHSGKSTEKSAPAIETEMLRKYIAFARVNITPELSEEACSAIEEFYVTIRKASQGTNTIPLTARKIDGLFRIAEANAKMRLSTVVTEQDAKEAIRLIMTSLSQIVNEETGFYDVDVIECGGTQSQHKRIAKYHDYIIHTYNFTLEEFMERFELSKENAEMELNRFRKEGKLVFNGEVYRKT
jgi:replicative DNA helicase Mcm